MTVTPCSTTTCAGLRQFAVAPALRGHVHDDGAGRHLLDHVARDQHGRLSAGHDRGGDDDVALGDDAAEQFALALVEAFVLGFCVSALVFGVLGLDRQFDEAAAHALHLLLRGGADVVGRHDRTEASGGGDRLEPDDAGADDEDPRRGDRAGGGREHREDAGQRVGGEQHRLVAADRGHRRERVHALGAGDARHQFDGEDRRARRGQLLDGLDGSQGPHEPDQRLTGPEQGEIVRDPSCRWIRIPGPAAQRPPAGTRRRAPAAIRAPLSA